ARRRARIARVPARRGARRRRPHAFRRRGRVRAGRSLGASARLPRRNVSRLVIEAVVFDLDGVILQTEEIWDEVRGRYVLEHGGRYDEQAQRAMMGMSAPEWSRYLADQLGVPGTPEEISADIVRLMEARYREDLPLLPGAVEAVERLAARWPLGLASSSNRPLIDTAL